MSSRKVAFVFPPTVADEAPGVTIRRTIGGERLVLLDPFLLLDHVTIDPAKSGGEVGFPRHPHRGIETLSYVLAGQVAHKDSLGNEGQVGPGGSQWMTAGNGIYHAEGLIPDENGGEFLQLWFNLPQNQKRIPAAYVGAPADTIPVMDTAHYRVRVVAGTFGDATGPFRGIAVNPTVLDVHLNANESITLPSAQGETAFAYVTAGKLLADGKTAVTPELMVFTDGDGLTVLAGETGARFLFVAAKPLNEPVLQYRSLVMNTVEDIRETLDMIENGTFATP